MHKVISQTNWYRTGQRKLYSQEETETFFDEQKKYACTTKKTVSDIRLISQLIKNQCEEESRERERVKRGERSHQLNCVYVYVKVIFIAEKWSGQELYYTVQFTE